MNKLSRNAKPDHQWLKTSQWREVIIPVYSVTGSAWNDLLEVIICIFQIWLTLIFLFLYILVWCVPVFPLLYYGVKDVKCWIFALKFRQHPTSCLPVSFPKLSTTWLLPGCQEAQCKYPRVLFQDLGFWGWGALESGKIFNHSRPFNS